MWRQYWIYFKGDKDTDYFNLLNTLVSPIVRFFNIEKFFFFRYLHDGMHYIRFRVKCSKSCHDKIKIELDGAVSRGTITKHADSDYDPIEDIAGRFGQTRYDDIIDMCELASKLALNYASGNEVYDPHPAQVGGVAGIIHLIANTLNYVVELEPKKKYNVKDWDRVQKREGRTP